MLLQGPRSLGKSIGSARDDVRARERRDVGEVGGSDDFAGGRCQTRHDLGEPDRVPDEHGVRQTGSGAAIDYGAVEQRIADALGAFERGLHAQIRPPSACGRFDDTRVERRTTAYL